jgi:AraC family transcriptional regulator
LKRVPDCLKPKQVKAVVEYIRSQLHSELRLEQIANQVGISPYYLAHAFRTTTEISPHQYVLHCRLERSQCSLRSTQMTIAEIAYEVGFSSQSHMTTVFRRMLYITPNKYRQQTAK